MKATVGAVVRGRTSLNYKTGAWRDMRPEIDQEACKRCGVCAEVCPDAAVHAVAEAGRKKPRYVIDYDYCKGCGLCVFECPADCLGLVPEVK